MPVVGVGIGVWLGIVVVVVVGAGRVKVLGVVRMLVRWLMVGSGWSRLRFLLSDRGFRN